MRFPEDFVEKLAASFESAEVDCILASMTGAKDVAYWINPLQPGPVNLGGERVTGVAGVYSLPAPRREFLMRSPEAAAGRVYPVNPSSVAAVEALDPRPGEEILDLAAAPGGKTVMIAARMENRGRIAAVESVKGRFHRMRANLDRCGVQIAALYLDDGRKTGRKTPGRFDRVLLDAPCSSEARIRLDDPSTYAHWSPRKIKETARKQRGLIRSAFAALKPGGTLVYCTCTFAPEENEEIVAYLLDREPDARMETCRRILPDRLWDGFFYATLSKVR